MKKPHPIYEKVEAMHTHYDAILNQTADIRKSSNTFMQCLDQTLREVPFEEKYLKELEALKGANNRIGKRSSFASNSSESSPVR